MEAWSIKALKVSPISRKLEIAQNGKTCSKQKKWLEIRKVSKKLPKSCQKGDLALIETPAFAM